MSTTLEVKLRTAAASSSSLTALLGTAPFRWYDTRRDQEAALPAVAVQLISAPVNYVINARLPVVESRVQFTIWDTDSERMRSVEAAIIAFLDTFNAYNSGDTKPQQPNRVVNRRAGDLPITEPLVYRRTLDAMIWNNENL